MTRAELLPFSQTAPVPRITVPGPASWSEADLAAHKIASIRRETLPPVVPQFPVGTWSLMEASTADRSGWLWHLEEHPLRDLLFQHGNPFDPSTWDWFSDIHSLAVEKYVAWLKQGFEPPPLEVWQLKSGRLSVEDGHNRAAALVTVGREHTLAWVSYYRQLPDGNWQTLTHRLAVEEALRAGKPVPGEVLAEYPDLSQPHR